MYSKTLFYSKSQTSPIIKKFPRILLKLNLNFDVFLNFFFRITSNLPWTTQFYENLFYSNFPKLFLLYLELFLKTDPKTIYILNKIQRKNSELSSNYSFWKFNLVSQIFLKIFQNFWRLPPKLSLKITAKLFRYFV